MFIVKQPPIEPTPATSQPEKSRREATVILKVGSEAIAF